MRLTDLDPLVGRRLAAVVMGVVGLALLAVVGADVGVVDVATPVPTVADGDGTWSPDEPGAGASATPGGTPTAPSSDAGSPSAPAATAPSEPTPSPPTRPTPSPSGPATDGPLPSPDTPTIATELGRVAFTSGRVTPSGTGRRQLVPLERAVRDLPAGARLLVVGHASPVGDDVLNDALALGRAAWVRSRLHDLRDDLEIAVEGRGSTEPAVTGSDRRAEVLLLEIAG